MMPNRKAEPVNEVSVVTDTSRHIETILERVAQAEMALAVAVTRQADAVAALAKAVEGMKVLDSTAVAALNGMGRTFGRMQAFQEQMVKRSTSGLNARVNAIAALGRELETDGP